MKVEILKSQMTDGSTLYAAASQAFGVRNSTKHMRLQGNGHFISIFKNGFWTDYDWFVDADKFTFITAQ